MKGMYRGGINESGENRDKDNVRSMGRGRSRMEGGDESHLARGTKWDSKLGERRSEDKWSRK